MVKLAFQSVNPVCFMHTKDYSKESMMKRLVLEDLKLYDLDALIENSTCLPFLGCYQKLEV